MPIPYYRCLLGHVFTHEDMPLRPKCSICQEERVVGALSAEDLMREAEQRLDQWYDPEQAHILADEALLMALYPSEPDLVRRYERLKGSFWYA